MMDEHRDFISDVVKHDGVPVVLAPYGVKKQKIGDQIYLVAMTPEERAEFLESIGVSGTAGICAYNALIEGCELSGGCVRCAWRNNDDVATCYCAETR